MRSCIVVLASLLAGVQIAGGCGCVNTGTACSWLKGTEVVFVGRVTVDSGEGWGTGLATLAVEEVLHGLPKDVREVEVDSQAGTSCYMRLEREQRYVLFARWKKGAPKQLAISVCGDSFALRGNEALLDALREAQAGRSSRLVGRVYRRKGKYSTTGGVTGIKVVAESEQASHETITGDNGQFEFRDIAPGSYRLRTESPGFLQDPEWPQDPRGPAVVPPHGCELRLLFVFPDGRIAGAVRDEKGKPLAGVPVQAFLIDEKSEIESRPLRVVKTDSAGRYVLRGLPPGEFVVGVNAEKYEDRLAYPPTLYLNTHRREEAARITVSEGAIRENIDLVLPAPREPAVVVVELVLPDGTPAEGGAVRALNSQGADRAFSLSSGNNTGPFRLSLYRGEAYRIVAGKFVTRPRVKADEISTLQFQGEAGPMILEAPETRVRIVLQQVPFGTE